VDIFDAHLRQLGGFITEHFANRAVCQNKLVCLDIDDEDAIGTGIENAAKFQFRFGELPLNSPPLRNVAVDAKIATISSVIIEDGTAAGFQDDPASVLVLHGIFQRRKGATLRRYRRKKRRYAFRFIGRHDAERRLAQKLVRLVAQRRLHP
jgi:hypothetical protein